MQFLKLTEENIEVVLDLFGVWIDGDYLRHYSQRGEFVKCHSCGEKIKKDDVTILPGPTRFVHTKNMICLIEAMEE
jgi:hypothetical protein